MNKVIFIGNLGQDPEVRFTGDGTAVCNLRVANNEVYRSKATGNKVEKTTWASVVVWGKTAENCGKYLRKGRQICVEGKLQNRQWEDRDGIKRYVTEIVASQVLFLGGGRGENKATNTEAETEHKQTEADLPPVETEDLKNLLNLEDEGSESSAD